MLYAGLPNTYRDVPKQTDQRSEMGLTGLTEYFVSGTIRDTEFRVGALGAESVLDKDQDTGLW